MADSSATQNSEEKKLNLTLRHLNILANGIRAAQSRGAFKLEEAAVLNEPVSLVEELIKNNQQTTNADESSDSGESNNSTESKTNNLNELPNTNSNTASANNEPKIIIEEHSN